MKLNMLTSSRYREASGEILKPLLRAYALGYLSATGPKLPSILQLFRKRGQSREEVLRKLSQIFLEPLEWNKFPTFCGLLVGGSIILQIPLRRLFVLLASLPALRDWKTSRIARERLIRFLTSFISAWLSFQCLNHRKTLRVRREQALDEATQGKTVPKDQAAEKELEIQGTPNSSRPSFVLVGKTMDLTLFGVTRALDICIGSAWSIHQHRRKAARKWTRVETLISSLADAGVFSLSVSSVMWAWFYSPERLPRSYNKWIGSAAQVDSRLIEALRQARRGEWVYGKDTGKAHILTSMCEDYGWPEEWGNPEKTIPIPCEMVHMGVGHSCEKHAASRFLKAFRFALATYLPLQLVMRLRAPSRENALQGVKEAARSSAFLGSFVSLFYYSVCLSRTRLGPKVLGDRVTPMMWDSGLCVAAGCMMCGWSILIEKARRRQEIAFFVAPRAAATLLPRRYEEKYQIREKVAFAISAAIIFTCVQERPERVRGVLGKLLTRVLA